MDNIHKDFESFAHDITIFQQLEDNPRRGDVEAIKKSFEEFGQVGMIQFRRRPDGAAEVFDGNHRLIAALELGWDRIAAIDVTGFSDEEIAALSLVMNRTSDMGTYDTSDLLAMVKRVNDPAKLLAAGYDKTTLEMLELVESRQYDFDREADEKRREKADAENDPTQAKIVLTVSNTTMDVWRSIRWPSDKGGDDDARMLLLLNTYLEAHPHHLQDDE